MRALPLNDPPPYWGSTPLYVGLKQAAAKAFPVVNNRQLSGLVTVDDLVHTGYIIMCQKPGLRWDWLVQVLYRAYLPVGRTKGQGYTGRRPLEWGSTYYPTPDSVYELLPGVRAWARERGLVDG